MPGLRRVALVVLAAACLVGVSACGGGVAAPNGLLATPQSAPTLSGALLDGGTLDTANRTGHVVVINFYASWCDPCRKETPLLEQAAAATKAQGVQFVGVLFKDSQTNGRAFRAAHGVSFPSLVDSDGTMLARFKGVNPTSIPDTFVLDSRGRLVARYIGQITDAAAFRQVLAQANAAPAVVR